MNMNHVRQFETCGGLGPRKRDVGELTSIYYIATMVEKISAQNSLMVKPWDKCQSDIFGDGNRAVEPLNVLQIY